MLYGYFTVDSVTSRRCLWTVLFFCFFIVVYYCYNNLYWLSYLLTVFLFFYFSHRLQKWSFTALMYYCYGPLASRNHSVSAYAFLLLFFFFFFFSFLFLFFLFFICLSFLYHLSWFFVTFYESCFFPECVIYYFNQSTDVVSKILSSLPGLSHTDCAADAAQLKPSGAQTQKGM